MAAPASPTGNDMDTYADDLAQLIDTLDRATSSWSATAPAVARVDRYVGRHGTSRVVKVVLLNAIPPLMLKTPDNPDRSLIETFDEIRAGVARDRSQFYKDLSGPFYRANRPGADVSQVVRDAFWLWSMRYHPPFSRRYGVARNDTRGCPENARRPSGQVRSAEMQDGHTLKTPTTAIRMATRTAAAPEFPPPTSRFVMLPGRCAPNQPRTTVRHPGPIRQSQQGGPHRAPDGPASTRGRHHIMAGILGGMPLGIGSRENPPLRADPATRGSGTRVPEHRIRALRTPAASDRATYRSSRSSRTRAPVCLWSGHAEPWNATGRSTRASLRPRTVPSSPPPRQSSISAIT